jgi:serine/threonine protein kinase
MLFSPKISQESASGIWQSQVGTPYYLSPEICEEKPYNELSDVGVPRVSLRAGMPRHATATLVHQRK